jgi:TetR/AcrR family fatty acid metabolism transcriptional regulator
MEEMTKRQKQALNTKKRILDTSLKLIKEQGYDAITIKQICEEAGVSIGAFYHHLRSKEDLIVEGYSECDKYFDEYVIHHLKSENSIDKILEYIGYQMKYAEKLGVGAITQVYKAQMTHGNEFFLSDERGLPKNLLVLVQEAQDEGLLRTDYEAKEIRDELLLISRGTIYNWCQRNGNFDLTDYCKKIILHHLGYFINKK